MRSSIVLLASALSLCAARVPAQGNPAAENPPRRTAPYDPALIDAISRIPVQEDGRVKPFRAFTDPLLLRLNERRSLTLPKDAEFGALAGTTMDSVEWALDMILYPEQAADYPVIVVTDREVLDLIGLSAIANTKRGRHSWNELEPGFGRLEDFFRKFPRNENEEPSHIQVLVDRLYHDYAEYSRLRFEFEGLRRSIPVSKSAILDATFKGHAGQVTLSEALSRFSTLTVAYMRLDPSHDPSGSPDPTAISERSAIETVLREVDRDTSHSDFVAWFVPSDPKLEEWDPLSKVAQDIGLHGTDDHQGALAAVVALERFILSAGDSAAVTKTGLAFADTQRKLCAARSDAQKVDLEVSYLNADWFGRAQMLFLFGFLASALSWLRPRVARWSTRISWGFAIVAELVLITGIVQRCILISRPPVATLYETILFITSILVLVAFVIEWIGRRRVALPLATALGALGMFLAYKYEVHKQADTIEEVQAVLRTNFWLGVHVTTVTIGYASTLLAGFIAHVFLIGKLFKAQRTRPAFFQSVARMVYGVVCFATFFSTFGTIAGGIWANDSWGRFWGWDPKENGALMIVLWNLLILHGRMGGLWRNWGMCLLAVMGNAVVAFSWWHVNALGIGLHSYGFDSGLYLGTMIFYGTQGFVLALGLAAYLRERMELSANTEGGQKSGETRTEVDRPHTDATRPAEA